MNAIIIYVGSKAHFVIRVLPVDNLKSTDISIFTFTLMSANS